MSCHTQFQNGFLFITTGTGNDLARCLKWGGGNNYSNKITIWKSGLCFKWSLKGLPGLGWGDFVNEYGSWGVRWVSLQQRN